MLSFIAEWIAFNLSGCIEPCPLRVQIPSNHIFIQSLYKNYFVFKTQVPDHWVLGPAGSYTQRLEYGSQETYQLHVSAWLATPLHKHGAARLGFRVWGLGLEVQDTLQRLCLGARASVLQELRFWTAVFGFCLGELEYLDALHWLIGRHALTIDSEFAVYSPF